jgi:hypothetical protein
MQLPFDSMLLPIHILTTTMLMTISSTSDSSAGQNLHGPSSSDEQTAIGWG